ncbi:MAG: class I SAM-dependent methyltransferase [Bacteroidales bacterium]|nr:class I SAM-dependent methyltransferase [Bacteroidales bacterium]
MKNKIHKDSKVELSPVIAKHYDTIMNSITFGKYNRFIYQAVQDMDIQTDDQILDLGCGTGKNAMLMSGYLGEKGGITGMDVSPVMGKLFMEKHGKDSRFEFKQERIDIPFKLEKKYDTVLISFVIHGLPHEHRKNLIQNAYNHLKPGGKLMILDYAEFDMAEMPSHHRFIFKSVECRYAFDFIEKDWKSILSEYGFSDFQEKKYMKNYTRLLSATKKA